MDILHIAAPILVGGLIGYCTNYIAIKMLFRPKRQIRLGRWKMPFTPGIIPRNKPRIARAVAQAVSNQLLTGEDLLQSVRESQLKIRLSDEVAGALFSDSISIRGIAQKYGGESAPDEMNRRISLVISEKIIDGAKKIDMEQLLTKFLQTSLSDVLANPVVAMFITPQMIASIGQRLGTAWKDYLDRHGKEWVWPMVFKEVQDFTAKSLRENMDSIHLEEGWIRSMTERVFDRLVETKGLQLLQSLNIASVIEKKINEMEVEQLEDLVMSVMKQELQAVINLGAVLGALIGSINIFF